MLGLHPRRKPHVARRRKLPTYLDAAPCGPPTHDARGTAPAIPVPGHGTAAAGRAVPGAVDPATVFVTSSWRYGAVYPTTAFFTPRKTRKTPAVALRSGRGRRSPAAGRLTFAFGPQLS